MRFANHAGRLVLLHPDGPDHGGDGSLAGARAFDIHRASGGRIPAEPERALERWDEVLAVAEGLDGAEAVAIDAARLGPPSPAPRQIFGIGVNYADHGSEAGLSAPEVPLVFTKLSTSVAGPFDPIPLSTATVDWEVEVVAVIGRRARRVAAADAWSHVAGLTVGQDLSDRDIQWRPQTMPQFSLGKSLEGFAPVGPLLVTPDAFSDPDDIELSCRLNGEEVQSSRTSEMLLSISEIVVYLSGLLTLHPGDLIFTGTPAGIGMTRTPPRYLVAGDQLDSIAAGIGTMSHTFVPSGVPSDELTATSHPTA